MDNNPYSPPTAKVSDIKNTSANAALPKSPKVIGIIFLIFAVFGAISVLLNLSSLFGFGNSAQADILASMGYSKAYLTFTTIYGFIFNLWFFFISYKILTYRDIGRIHYNYYLIISIIMGSGSLIYQKFFMQGVNNPFSTGSLFVVMLILLAILYGIPWYYLNKPEVKASLT
ncbi:hypothetical protein [Thiolinea disciformis]|uniref:hypothetical protein n=1 Tax=Thiolinea disciformis TaxID=125614 RepID=UPI0003829F04|nr:hypothetical protein [Thiolinea disciformis]